MHFCSAGDGQRFSVDGETRKRYSVDRKHFIRFRSKDAVYKFIRLGAPKLWTMHVTFMVTRGREDHFWARFCFSHSGCALFFSWVESTLLRRASFSGWGKGEKTRKMKNKGTSFSLSSVPRALPFPHLPRLRALTFKPLDLPISQQRVQKKIEAFEEERGSRACPRFFEGNLYSYNKLTLNCLK